MSLPSNIFVFTGHPDPRRAHEDTITLDGIGCLRRDVPLAVSPDSARVLRTLPRLFREVDAPDAPPPSAPPTPPARRRRATTPTRRAASGAKE